MFVSKICVIGGGNIGTYVEKDDIVQFSEFLKSLFETDCKELEFDLELMKC